MTFLARPIIGGLVIASLAVVQAQTTPTPPKPTQQTTSATPPATTGTPQNQPQVPPPPPPVTGLTPPIQSQTPTAKVPAMVDVPNPPVPTPGVPITPLTAEDAARLALHFQPNVAIFAQMVVDARGQLVQQKSALFPNIGLRESFGQSDNYYGRGANGEGTGSTTTGGTAGGTTGTGTTGTGTTGSNNTLVNGVSATNGVVSLSQLIFDFDHTLDMVRAADFQVKAAEANYTKQQIDTVLTVKQDYYTFVQNEGLVDVQQAGVTSAQAALDVAQAELNAGLGAPADVVNAKTTLANDIQTLIQARATMVTSRIALCLAMGIDPRTPLVASKTTSESVEDNRDLNALVNEAVHARPDVFAAIATLRAAGYTVSAARTTDAPALSLEVNNSNQGTDYRFISGASLSAELAVTWTFDDGGLTAGKVESAKAQAEEAKQQLQLVTQTVISDVSQAYVNVKTAEEEVDNSKNQVQNATENLRLAQGQYAAGVTPFVTVITAQAALIQANSAQVNAIATLAQSRATLRHAVGQGL